MVENNTVSVSKGVFVFKNNFKHTSMLSHGNTSKMFSKNLWHKEFNLLWNSISEDIEVLTCNMFSLMTKDLLSYIRQAYYNSSVCEIPTAALLTGINMPDHDKQFKNLKRQIINDVSPHVALLNSQDCSSVKSLMDNMVYQFLNNSGWDKSSNGNFGNNFKKSQLNLSLLERWYENLYYTKNKSAQPINKNLLIVVLPNFESFNIGVLQKFILIASSYLQKLPFLFVFGIATSISTLYTAFPYHVSSKISIKVFKNESSIHLLKKILENVFLNSFCAFQLGGKIFNLFTDIFLFYDYSVNNFIQNIKYTMMEHFCYGNAMALCSLDRNDVKNTLNIFKSEDFENVRHLKSFRQLVESESYQNQINLLTNDVYLKGVIFENIVILQKYIRRLHIFLRCLYILVSDLPGHPLGKHLYELYATCVSEDVTKTPQYQECLRLLSFQSQNNLCVKLNEIVAILDESINKNSKRTQMKEFYSKIKDYIILLNDLNDAEMDVVDESISPNNSFTNCTDRKSLKESLLLRTKSRMEPLTKYAKLRKDILETISSNFEIHLVQPSSLCFYEIFFFDDISIQNKIIGIHRTAIHTALNDPQVYLQCNCCKLNNSHSIKPKMPDICITYKLHLECGKMINMYDWLQAFLCIIDSSFNAENNTNSKINPQYQQG
ncbi:origin recognition complex subunit 3 isoform X2 [Sitophilus oryzae]|uniref:Origin recognition complex subunit 3 n=1 Tax=Sitophilus oryzae TaxID=7048 RepID=A0A6J2X821_SITOR|nr:origin recognition complex subunit 3 isoform X2 [Sitophilus oryzae]